MSDLVRNPEDSFPHDAAHIVIFEQIDLCLYLTCRLDDKLYQMCHKDAMQLCHASEDWHVSKPGADNSPMVFSCLYRHFKTEEVCVCLIL